MSPGSSRLLNSENLPTVCARSPPLRLSVPEFCDALAQPDLATFWNAPITSVNCLHDPTGISHHYLILRLRIGEASGHRDVWARCERNPGPYSGSPKRLLKIHPISEDTVSLSYDKNALKENKDQVICSIEFDNLNVFHIINLLKIVHEVSPRYNMLSHNCWWFCWVALEALKIFENDWSVRLVTHWTNKASKAIKAVSSDTRAATDAIKRRFTDNWGYDISGSPISNVDPIADASNTPSPQIPNRIFAAPTGPIASPVLQHTLIPSNTTQSPPPPSFRLMNQQRRGQTTPSHTAQRLSPPVRHSSLPELPPPYNTLDALSGSDGNGNIRVVEEPFPYDSPLETRLQFPLPDHDFGRRNQW